MARFIVLPGAKTVIDVDNIAFILHPELNTYVVVPKQTVSPSIPKLNGNEYDALVAYIGAIELEVKPEAEPAEKPLIERVAGDGKKVIAASKA